MAASPLQINDALPAASLAIRPTRHSPSRLMSGKPSRTSLRLVRALAVAGITLSLLHPPLTAAQTRYVLGSTAVSAFGEGPYGSVSLSQDSSDVRISVSLREDLNFVNTGSHAIFSFNLPDAFGPDQVSGIRFANGLNNVFGVINHADNAPFGTFSYGITCTDRCTSGGSGGGYADPLTFTVHEATIADFNQPSSGKGSAAYFAADLINRNGITGAAGATSVSAVPEPASYAMLLAGLGLIGSIIKRRRRDDA